MIRPEELTLVPEEGVYYHDHNASFKDQGYALLGQGQEAVGKDNIFRLKIFMKRFAVLIDMVSDTLVVIDNATDWDDTYMFVLHWDPVVDPWWARIGAFFIAVPFLIEWILMWGIAVNTMIKRGVPCPDLVWFVGGLPA